VHDFWWQLRRDAIADSSVARWVVFPLVKESESSLPIQRVRCSVAAEAANFTELRLKGHRACPDGTITVWKSRLVKCALRLIIFVKLSVAQFSCVFWLCAAAPNSHLSSPIVSFCSYGYLGSLPLAQSAAWFCTQCHLRRNWDCDGVCLHSSARSVRKQTSTLQ
jgi:hypothetical protein